jgi:hypothetical protein
MKIIKSPEIILAYRNRNSFLIYSTGLANINFALPLTFNFAFILFGLDILSDAFLGRRSYDNVMVIAKIQYLFQLDRNKVTY